MRHDAEGDLGVAPARGLGDTITRGWRVSPAGVPWETKNRYPTADAQDTAMTSTSVSPLTTWGQRVWARSSMRSMPEG